MSTQCRTDAADLRVRRVEDYETFVDLKSDWNRLQAQTESRSVFLRHEWFDAAWQWEKTSARLNFLCFYRDSTLIGTAPFVVRSAAVGGVAFQTLTFLTVPDTQIADLLSAKPNLPAVCRALARELRAQRNEWHVLELNKLHTGSSTIEVLTNELSATGLRPAVESDGANLLLMLDEAWDKYYGRRSRRLKKGNNLVRNHIDAQFSNVEVVHSSTADGELLADIIGVSKRSWKHSTGTTLDRPGPNAFIERLTAHAAREGWLSVFCLYLDRQPAAMEYQIEYGGDVYALRADFVTELEAWSPGTYLNLEMLKKLFGKGKARYLMGPGENAYKLRWAEASENMVRVRAFNDNTKARLVWTINSTLVTARRLRERALSITRKSPKGDSD